MTSVVLDTNVLLSGVYRGGKPPQALIYCLKTENVLLYLSTEIVAEYRNVLSRLKFGFSSETIAHWIESLIKVAAMTSNVPPLDFPRDRKDAKFLALARAVAADFLITGDRDFTDLPTELLHHTRIVSATEFCAMMNL